MAAAALFVLCFAVYSANGREIGSYDTRPTGFAAREMLLRGTLALDHVVGATPEYGSRWGFMLAHDGRYRAVYSPVPALAAAALFWPAWHLKLIDIRAPLAPQLMAKVTASVLVAAAVAMAFLTALTTASRRSAVLIAAGLGLGTGLWSLASQTLWQTESAVFGLALSLLVLSGTRGDSFGAALALGAGLALAVTARAQVLPAAAVLLLASWRLASPRTALIAAAVVATACAILAVFYVRWFGHPLGALPLLTAANDDIHRVNASFRLTLAGIAGLLVSPSRGLFVFSPVVAVALAGSAAAWRGGVASLAFWCLLAVGVEFSVYASYTVWWGGHTFGPRYALDMLPLFVPLAAAALTAPHRVAWKSAAAAALAWSVLVAATGAFCYPHDAWNSDPTDIDRDHARLWSVADNQIARCWQRGLSPQNFSLVDAAAFRRPAKP